VGTSRGGQQAGLPRLRGLRTAIEVEQKAAEARLALARAQLNAALDMLRVSGT